MTQEEKIALLEDMMELDENTLQMNTLLADLDEWDSLAAVSLIVLLDEKFKSRITASEIKKLRTVSDILAYMN